jgi:elongation factor Tu
MNKMDLADADLVELVEDGNPRTARQERFRPRRPIIKGSATKALEGDAANEDAIMELVASYGRLHPRAKARPRQAIPDAYRRRLLHQGSWYRCYRSYRAGIVKINDEVEIVGIRPPRSLSLPGIEAFKKNLDQGQAGDNAGVLLRGIERDDIERGQVWLSRVPSLRTPSLTLKSTS